MRWLLPILALWACEHPGYPEQQVQLRGVSEDGPTTGERGTVKIAEILWSGSVTNEGVHDPTDVFVEIRNEGNKPINLSRWLLEMEGAQVVSWRIPDTTALLGVGEQVVIAAKTSGCFPHADLVIPDLQFPPGDPFRLTLLDADEHLIEPAGSTSHEPFVGGYDLVRSRSMERINLMFGGAGSEPETWHFYNKELCGTGNDLSCFDDIPNNDLVAAACRRNTLASPGRANSPDYSGAQAGGGFE